MDLNYSVIIPKLFLFLKLENFTNNLLYISNAVKVKVIGKKIVY